MTMNRVGHLARMKNAKFVHEQFYLKLATNTTTWITYALTDNIEVDFIALECDVRTRLN